MAFGKRVSLAYTDDEKIERMMPRPIEDPDRDEFPANCLFTLCESEIEKIEANGMDCECERGDVIDLRLFCSVKNVSLDDGPDGKRRTITLQIEDVLMFEDESTEEPGEE